MAKQEFAPGLPDPRRFGALSQLPKNQELLWVIQRHLAERAGPHYDIRFGENKGTAPTLFSFATKKLPEAPGQKVLVFQQPLHTGQYADFEGDITAGYGKGTVKTHDKGTVLVTKVEPDKINFAVIHKKFPETFTLIRKSNAPAGETTARQRKTQGGTWLMINTTPTEIIKHKKVHYAKVPQEKVEKMFDPDYLASEKIDGAAALYKLFSDKIEVLSYRPSTTGRPIVHTYRVGGTTGINVPKHLVGSVLRGEIYGARRATGESIPPQELGGILNATTEKSLRKQREQGVELRNALFNVLRYGKEDVSMNLPLEDRLRYLREVVSYLPSNKFHLPTTAESPEEQRKLWEDIVAGRNPRTREGMVFWPRKGGKPTKVKLYDEHDVYIREFFPGQKGLEGKGIGGFRYSTTPEGPVLGEVGTGFSSELRRQMMEDPEEYLGRIAKIRAQEQFPSGAYRAPSLLAIHEDYPAQKAAMAKEALRLGGKIGLGLVGAGLVGPSVIRALAGRHATQRAGVPLPVPEESIRENLQGEAIPYLVAAEDAPTEVQHAPSHGAYLGPEEERTGAIMRSWLPYVPYAADDAERHGLVLAKERLPAGLLAHELGHGTGLGSKPIWRKIIGELAPASMLATPAALGVGAMGSKLGGGLVGAGVRLPNLFEETRANLRAYHALKQLGVEDPDVYKTLRNIQISHTAPVLGSASAGVGAALLRKALSKAAAQKEARGPRELEQDIVSPTTWTGLAGEATILPALSTAWHGLKTLPKHFAPSAVAKSIGHYLGSPLALAAGMTSDVSGIATAAKLDPDYEAGNISYMQALGRQLGARGEAAQLKTQKAFGGKLGALKGLLASPVQGLSAPVSAAAGFIQALKRAGKKLVGADSEKKASILGPYIKQASGGSTLADMIKPAVEMPEFLQPREIEEPAFLRGPKPVDLRTRLMSWMLGVKPKELAGLQSALSGVGKVTNKLKSITTPEEKEPEPLARSLYE